MPLNHNRAWLQICSNGTERMPATKGATGNSTCSMKLDKQAKPPQLQNLQITDPAQAQMSKRLGWHGNKISAWEYDDKTPSSKQNKLCKLNKLQYLPQILQRTHARTAHIPKHEEKKTTTWCRHTWMCMLQMVQTLKKCTQCLNVAHKLVRARFDSMQAMSKHKYACSIPLKIAECLSTAQHTSKMNETLRACSCASKLKSR